MKHVVYTCDRCGKSTSVLFECYMRYMKYDGFNTDAANTSYSIELCKDCLEKYKSMFKKKTASGKEIPEAEA